MRTLFVTSFHVLISRNILSTECFRRLSHDPDLRVVLFVPDYKRAYFETTFGRPRLTVIGINPVLGRFERVMRAFALLILDSQAMAIKRRWELVPERRYILFLAKSLAASLIAGRAWAGRLLRWLDRRLGPEEHFRDAFLRFRPDAVLATDVLNELDVECVRSASRRGVRVVGMVRSWDNLTAKGFLRAVPDILAVHTALIRDEAVGLHRVPAERIRVTGIPHYDAYLGYRPSRREEFLRSLGLDPKGRLALVAPIGDRYIRRNKTDRALLEALAHGRASGALPPDLQVLVRLPPMDSVALDGFHPPEWMKVERPGVAFRPGAVKEAELSAEDDRRLADSLAACDVLVTGPSTMAVDAARADKPIILVAFENNGAGYWGSVVPWYDYDHFRPIVSSGGARVVRTEAELLERLRVYLECPELDREGRERIVEIECGPLDGRASERLYHLIAEALAHPKPHPKP